MRVLITGGRGQVGRAFQAIYAGRGEIVAPGRDELDVTNPEQVRAAVIESAPELIVHAGALTDVDGCETRVEEAYRTNAFGTRTLALMAAARDLPLVYLSTNYVFDGAKPVEQPYHEWDDARPLSVYGHSKLAGEEEVRRHARRHFIVRAALVYDATGDNFVRTMLRLADEGRRPVRVVDDQWGQPTFATDLAAALLTLARTRAYGTYHLTNTGACSAFEWAREVFRLAGRDVAVEPIPTSAYPRPAARPANGLLANWAGATLGIILPDWRDGLARCLAEMGQLSAED